MMKGYIALRDMEEYPGKRYLHGGMHEGAYYFFDGGQYSYCDGGTYAPALIHGVALARTDWRPLDTGNDIELAKQLELEAARHIAKFRGKEEFEVAMAAAYAHGLEHAAQLLRDRNG